MASRKPFSTEIVATTTTTKILAKHGSDPAGYITEDRLLGTVPEWSMGVVADGATNDTAALETWMEYGASSGKLLTLSGRARIVSDFTVTGGGATDRLRVHGLGPAAFVADGASRITLAGTWDVVEFDSIGFEDFTHSPFWIGDNASIGELRFNNCKSIDNLLFLSAQGNPAQAGYTTSLTHLPNAGTTISHLRVTNCEISGGRAGIVLPIVVERAHIEGNTITGLANSTATGGELEHAVTGIQIGPLGGNAAEGDFEAVGADYSADYDRMVSTCVINNKLDSLVQNEETKACMGIGVNGFGCVVLPATSSAT